MNIFKGMINDQNSPLSSALQEVLKSLPPLFSRLSHARAKVHATYGVGRRLGIIHVNVREILKLTDRPNNSPLYGSAQCELGMHLNSFYIHLHGLLDNLAWMLAYELSLFENLSEDNPEDRNRIGLFRKSFKKKITNTNISNLLDRHSAWYASTKQLRDPIAHRVPLYAVPCVLTEDEATHMQKLQEEEMEALRVMDLAKAQAIHEQIFKIGDYHPIFGHDNSGDSVIVSIRDQIEQDTNILIEIMWNFIEDQRSTQHAPPVQASPH